MDVIHYFDPDKVIEKNIIPTSPVDIQNTKKPLIAENLKFPLKMTTKETEQLKQNGIECHICKELLQIKNHTIIFKKMEEYIEHLNIHRHSIINTCKKSAGIVFYCKLCSAKNQYCCFKSLDKVENHEQQHKKLKYELEHYIAIFYDCRIFSVESIRDYARMKKNGWKIDICLSSNFSSEEKFRECMIACHNPPQIYSIDFVTLEGICTFCNQNVNLTERDEHLKICCEDYKYILNK